MKKLWAFCAFFLASALFADAPRSDGLIFHHTFESSNMSADFAVGSKTAKNNNATLTEGISGKGLLVGYDDKLHNLQFPTVGNFNKLEGSVSFWMKPVDYDGNSAGWAFIFDAAEPSNQGFRFYKYNGPNGFFWFSSGRINPAERKTDIQIVHARLPQWKRGQWHHVVITWRAGGQTYIGKESRQRIYVDGKLMQERTLDDKFIPQTIPALFTIGPSSVWGNTPATHTVIDELKIYNCELLADQVRTEYYRFYTPETSGNNTLSATLATSAPVMDCRTPWENAVKYNVFYNNRKIWSSDLGETGYFLTYDENNLYIRIQEPLNGRTRSMTQRGRDGELYRDDCWEIYIGTGRNEQYRHYVFNGSGDVYDGIGRTGNWNGNSRHTVSLADGMFCLDIAIPAADLGLEKFTAGSRLIFSLGKTLCNAGSSRVYYSNNLLGGHFHDFQKFSDLILSAANSGSGAAVVQNDTKLEIAGAFPQGGKAELSRNGQKVQEIPLTANGGTVTMQRADGPMQYTLKISGSDLDISIPFTSVPNLLVDFRMNPENGNLTALLYPASAEIESTLAGTQLEMVFYDSNNAVTARKTIPFTKEVVITPAEQPTVSGHVQLTFSKDGRQIMRCTAGYYHINFQAWKDYNGGLDDNDVPTPWTPVTYAGGILGCWERQYDFSRRALPEQLLQAGNPLLRSKAVLRAVIGGRRYDLSDIRLNPVYTSKGKYILKGSAEIAGCKIEVSLNFEFDGFTLLDFKIDRKNVKIDSLCLEFPMHKDVSLLKFVPFLNEQGVQRDDIGFVKDEQFWRFTPGIWVGNDERGFTWFSESDEFFYLNDRERAIALTRNRNGEATLRINFIDHADPKMPKVLNYVFGFQVTPLKPFPEPQDWMNYAFVAAPNAKIFISGWHNRVGRNYQGFPGFDGCIFGADHEKENLAHTTRLTTSSNQYRRPMMPIRYLYPNMCAITLPEFNAFRSYWVVSPSDVWSTDGPEVVPSTRVSPMAQSWANFFCYRFDRYFATTLENGMYQDFCHPIKDSNELHGAGYVRDGKRYPTYCLYKFREIQLRLYRIAKKYETPARRIFFIGHTGGSYILPHANFFTLVNEGEYLGAVVNQQKPYLDFFDEGRWRAEWNGRQFGLLINFIPSRSQDLKFTEEIFSIIVPGSVTWMLHTVIAREPQQRVYRAYEQFGGYSGVEKFLPYWNNSDHLNVSHDDIKATLLVKGKKALLLVGNWNKDKIDAIFTFNNLSVVKVTDCDTRQEVPLTADEFTYPVAGKNFRIFLLELE